MFASSSELSADGYFSFWLIRKSSLKPCTRVCWGIRVLTREKSLRSRCQTEETSDPTEVKRTGWVSSRTLKGLWLGSRAQISEQLSAFGLIRGHSRLHDLIKCGLKITLVLSGKISNAFGSDQKLFWAHFLKKVCNIFPQRFWPCSKFFCSSLRIFFSLSWVYYCKHI